MIAFEKTNAWKIVDRLKGKNIIRCEWIFTMTYKGSGSLKSHKARLVVKGYTQT